MNVPKVDTDSGFIQVFGMPSLNQDDHVGDWEHSMVRFIDGAPTFIYLSSHTSGQAFNYSVLQPITNTTTSTNTTSNPSITSYANRAITYIARGTHANYAVPGNHPHGPMNALSDVTDAGPLWDITLNFRGYWFDNSTEMFSVAGGVGRGGREERSEGLQQWGAKSLKGQTKGFGEERVKQRGLEGGDEGVGWLEFLGKWGDQSYPVPEHGQVCFMGTCKFTDGPTGESYSLYSSSQPHSIEVLTVCGGRTTDSLCRVRIILQVPSQRTLDERKSAKMNPTVRFSIPCNKNNFRHLPTICSATPIVRISQLSYPLYPSIVVIIFSTLPSCSLNERGPRTVEQRISIPVLWSAI